MAAIMMKRGRQLIAAFVVSLLCVSTALSQTPASKPSVGRVIGTIDGISRDGEQFFIAGWACQQGRSESIQLHIFAGADPAKNVFLTAHKANFYSEAAVKQACQDRQGGKHRFLVALPFENPGSTRPSRVRTHARVRTSSSTTAGSSTALIPIS
jgi:hypothetical protein